MDSIIVLRHLLSVLILIFQIGVGTIICSQFNKRGSGSFLDNLYFAVVTISTIGYGDITPGDHQNGLRVIVGIYGFIGPCIFAGELDLLMTFYIDKLESWCFEGLRERGKQTMRTVYSIMTILGFWGVGTIGALTLEGSNFWHAIYLACISATTVGFGDISFETPNGRIFCIIWILLSQPCLLSSFSYLRRPGKIIPFQLPESINQRPLDLSITRRIGVPMTFFNTKALWWTLKNFAKKKDVIFIIHVLSSPPKKIPNIMIRDQHGGAHPILLEHFLDQKVYTDLGLKEEEIERLDFKGCQLLANEREASIRVKVTWGDEREELTKAIRHLLISDVVMVRRNCGFLQRILLQRLTSHIAKQEKISFTELKAA